jgi:RNA 2',3'-cyclic 3'-phosphodiesterase
LTSRATVEGDERLRLFLALEVPKDVSAALAAWAARHLAGLRTIAPHHVTLAFLGARPARDLDGVLAALRDAVAAARAGPLGIVRYRETRSVSMLVLDDPAGRAAALAIDLHDRLERLGVYRREARPWLPHVTVARFRERPRLAPPLPEIGAFVPSAAAAFLSRLHPSGARYEVLESYPLRVDERGEE